MSVNAVGYCQYQTYVPFAIFTMDGVCVQVGSGIVTGGMFCESLGLSNTNDEHSPSLFTWPVCRTTLKLRFYSSSNQTSNVTKGAVASSQTQR